MPIEDFQILGELGRGTFSSVVKVKRRSDGQTYAMKLIKINKLKQKQKTNALNQIRFLASINHINIIAYYEAFYNQKTQDLCIVMQYANKGDLAQLLKAQQRSKIRLKQSFIWKMVYQILEGLNRLHELKIIHRDIKPANIFFHNNHLVKIGDLNVSKHLKDPFTVTQTGTPYYASPQVWGQEPYDFKSDVWSLGCIIYEAITYKPPFQGPSPEILYKKILLGEYKPIPSFYSKELSLFIKKLLNINHKQRPGCKQLLLEIKKNLQLKQLGCIRQESNSLVQTIKFPANLKQLNQKLPKSQYNLDKSKKQCKTLKVIKIQEENIHSKKISGLLSMKIVNSNKNIQDIKFKDLDRNNKNFKQNKNKARI